MKLKNKVALITGSSSGIGKAIALLFAKEGADVVISSNVSVDEGNKVLEEVIKLGSDAIYIQADLTREEDIKRMFEKIKEKYGRIDILINNAGRTFYTDFNEINYETIKKDIDTNLISTVLCSKYAVQLMGPEGWIVNTSSIRGKEYCGRPNVMGYSIAKAGINSITKTLALELAPNIYVNTIEPGVVHTDYVDKLDDEKRKFKINSTLIKRFIEPEEIAEIYLMLATSRIFTGTIITADGGYTLLNK